MKKLFSISEAAALVGMTSETLRHYDRIGLVRPGVRDEWTGYRYYSEQEIVRLNTIQALRCMDLSLKDIRRALEYDGLEELIAFLRSAEKSADEKIARLQQAKEKIKRARADYEKKLAGPQENGGPFVRRMPERVLLLSNTLQRPALDNLWHYHDHFTPSLAQSGAIRILLKMWPAFIRRAVCRACLPYAYAGRTHAASLFCPRGTICAQTAVKRTGRRVLPSFRLKRSSAAAGRPRLWWSRWSSPVSCSGAIRCRFLCRRGLTTKCRPDILLRSAL